MITCPTRHSPATLVADLQAYFRDDHVHMALVVSADGRLVTTVERSDLVLARASMPVPFLGTLVDRTVGPMDSLDEAAAYLVLTGRRRLAVVDEAGRLLGLLCLKKDGTGFCSDAGVRERARMRTADALAHTGQA
jgi:CBS-domain-containing membrane protein